MKIIWGRSVLVAGLLAAIFLLVVLLRTSNPPVPAEPPHVPPLGISATDQKPTPEQSNIVARLLEVGGCVRAAEFTNAEKMELAKKFREKFKPAIEKWCKAYEGRVPFLPEDVTLDKFHSLLKPNLYTFMVNDNTLTFQEPKGAAAKVFYMTKGDTLKTLNSMPRSGTVPDLTIPVNREEVIRMVKADSGVEFKPNECVIKPTGASGALAGGAFVDMLPTGADPNNGLSSKIDMVFGPDGKLVYYDRDPFF